MRVLTKAVCNTFLAQLGVTIPVSKKRKDTMIKINGKYSSDTAKQPLNNIIIMFKNSSFLLITQVFNSNYVNKPSNNQNILGGLRYEI